MIDASAIADIIATYKKYGWTLRRVLLSPTLKEKIGTWSNSLFGEVAIADSNIDAAWFSREPGRGTVAWEVRYLGDSPFALLENVDENDTEFEYVLHGVEERLREYVAVKRSA